MKTLESHAGLLLLDHSDSEIGILPNPIDTLRYMPTAAILGRLELALFKSRRAAMTRFDLRIGSVLARSVFYQTP